MLLICFYNLHSDLHSALHISIILRQFRSTTSYYTYLISINHWISTSWSITWCYQSFNINFIHYIFVILIFKAPVFHIIDALWRSVPQPSFSIYRQSISTIFQFQCCSFVLNFINATGRIVRWVDAEQERRTVNLIEPRLRKYHFKLARDRVCYLWR